MASVTSISARAHSAAARPVVFALLTDHTSWTSWSPFSSVSIEEPGLVQPEGEGAVRATRYRGSTSRERILSVTPVSQVTYTFLSGSLAPYMRDYVGVVDLAEAAGGTDIHWHSTFTPKFPGSGLLPRLVLRRFLQRCTDGLAQQAAESS